MVSSCRIKQGRVADALPPQLGNRSGGRSRDKLIIHAVGRRGQTNDRPAARDQRIGRDMISRDEIDAALEKRRLRDVGAVAELEADLHAKLIPDTGLLDHLPDRQMRVRPEKSAKLDWRIIFHELLSTLLIPVLPPHGSASEPAPDRENLSPDIFALLPVVRPGAHRSEEHTSELQSLAYLVCRLLLEKKKNQTIQQR